MTGSPGHGWAVLAAMFVLFAAGFTVYWAESQPHPLHSRRSQQARTHRSGGNMEGKEVRNGIAESALFATITTDASCGAVNGMHDSFTPLGGMVPLVNIMLGEVVFGGVGAGMYGMLIFVVLAVFIAGLMVGRTPEYLGKKIEGLRREDGHALRAHLPAHHPVAHRVFVLWPSVGLPPSANPGPHGLTEILYAFTSGAGNNGSAFAGLSPTGGTTSRWAGTC
jgi:K+-transporting ATPase ATPase A chain